MNVLNFVERKRWTKEELSIFEDIWTPSVGRLPNSSEIARLADALSSRSVHVIRSRASNLLRKMNKDGNA